MKKAFTLAEIMIVLSVIGILTAILLPAAMHSTPDENILKFKKANTTLGNVVRELAGSEKYYLEGDLSKKLDGSVILGSFSLNSGEITADTNLVKYFCTTFADILNTKSVNCSTEKTGDDTPPYTYVQIPSDETTLLATQYSLANGKKAFDTACKDKASDVGEEIVLSDDTVFYQANPAATFGVMWGPNKPLFAEVDSNGLLYNYKVMCLDIDGIDRGEDPFGYGIRLDGKILLGERADEWVKMAIQQKD